LTKAAFLSKYNNTSLFFIDGSEHPSNVNGTIDFWIYLNGAYTGSLYLILIDGSNGYAANNYLLTSLNGFNKNDSNQYQHIVIPYNSITWLKPQFNDLQLYFGGTDTSGAKGLYVDYIRLQSGIPNIPQPTYADSAGTYKIDSTHYVTKTWIKGISKIVGDTITTGSGGAPTRFGIEDNLGLQDRSIDMQGFNFEYTNSNNILLKDGVGNQLINLSGNGGEGTIIISNPANSASTEIDNNFIQIGSIATGSSG